MSRSVLPCTEMSKLAVWVCNRSQRRPTAKTVKGRQLTNRRIRRSRRELTAVCGPAPVIVFTKRAYALFDIEAVMELAGLAPRLSLRRKLLGDT